MLKAFSTPFVPQRINVAAEAATGLLYNYPTTVVTVNITDAGSVSVTFYDNAVGDTSGSKVGVLPATTTVGQIFQLNGVCFLGLSASGGAGTPGYIISHAPSQQN